MHTSPLSTGVTSCPGISCNNAASIDAVFGVSYALKTSASSARESNVLSTPHNTSPSGLPLVSTALVTNSPASPPCTTSTAIPVAAVKASKMPGVGVNDSCASNVRVTGPSVEPIESVEFDVWADEQPAAKIASVPNAIRCFLISCLQCVWLNDKKLSSRNRNCRICCHKFIAHTS